MLGLACGDASDPRASAGAQGDTGVALDASQDSGTDLVQPPYEAGQIVNAAEDASIGYEGPRTDLDAGVCVSFEDGSFAPEACRVCRADVVYQAGKYSLDAGCSGISHCVFSRPGCYDINDCWCEANHWRCSVQSCP